MENSSIIEDFIRLKYNIFTLAPIMMAFYSTSKVERNNVILHSIVLPLVTSNRWLTEPQKIQNRSKLFTWIKENRLPLSGFSYRMEIWKGLSTATLQYCIDRGWANIDEKNNVIVTEKFEVQNYSQHVVFKNALNLSKLIDGMNVEEILINLGIRKI